MKTSKRPFVSAPRRGSPPPVAFALIFVASVALIGFSTMLVAATVV